TIWFFTSRTGPFAPGGAATATFSSKGHDLFARFSGTLSEETNQSRLEEEWSPAIEAWFPGGKNDPDLLMLRMDLNQAEIWNANLGFIDTAKMLLGFDVRQDAEDDHTRTSLSEKTGCVPHPPGGRSATNRGGPSSWGPKAA